MDHMLDDGSRGYGEVIVDCNLYSFTTPAEARELATDLERIAVILEGMDHVAVAHDNGHDPFP